MLGALLSSLGLTTLVNYAAAAVDTIVLGTVGSLYAGVAFLLAGINAGLGSVI